MSFAPGRIQERQLYRMQATRIIVNISIKLSMKICACLNSISRRNPFLGPYLSYGNGVCDQYVKPYLEFVWSIVRLDQINSRLKCYHSCSDTSLQGVQQSDCTFIARLNCARELARMANGIESALALKPPSFTHATKPSVYSARISISFPSLSLSLPKSKSASIVAAARYSVFRAKCMPTHSLHRRLYRQLHSYIAGYGAPSPIPKYRFLLFES
jgi:hypothetical protein